MGHDVVCQLCGVGFGVGRIRTPQEPRSAAWHAYGWNETSRGFVRAEREQRYDRCSKQNDPLPRKLRSGQRHGVVQEVEESGGCQVFRRPPLVANSGQGSHIWYNEDEGSGLNNYQHQDDDGGDIELDDDSLEDDHDESGSSKPNNITGSKEREDNDSDDLPEDETYTSSNGSEDFNPLEYSSDIDDLGQDDSDDLENDDNVRGDQLPWSFSVNAIDKSRRMDIIDTDFEPLKAAWKARRPSPTGDDENDIDDIREEDEGYKLFEHIAGPDCRREDGYNGHHITVNEILYGQTAQFLCKKRSICPPNEKWLRADDDLDFELESDCFLTGLATAAPCSDDDSRLQPPRHGLERIGTDNEIYVWESDSPLSQGLPFHPTCFELFRQMSRVTFNGRTEIDGLMRLRDATCKCPSTWPVEYNDDVKKSQEQSWRCLTSCEYLVANPIYVEALAPILSAAAAARHGPGFSIQCSAFKARTPALPATVDGDPFLRLPVEVTRCVLDYLGSKDIASMRSASHAFQQLPVSLWYRLVRDEMPYLYEAWSDDITPYPWSSWLVLECEKFARVKKSMVADVAIRRNVIKEDMPEILEEWIKNEKVMTDEELEFQLMSDERRKLLESKPINLELGTTDWYQLYTDITIRWRSGRLKGLRNRARIWDNIGQVINSIKEMRVAECEDTPMAG